LSFKELFDYAQEQPLYVKRNDIRDKAIELTEAETISVVRSGLDVNVCRGYWLTPQNVNHPLVKQLGQHIVVVARDNNECWERFVVVKEMMHLFDTDEQKAADAQMLDSLLSEFSAPMAPFTPQFDAEIDSFWQALAVLCPQEARANFRKDLVDNKTDEYEIALKLKIPEGYVQRLFEDRFDDWLKQNGCI
jgi:hypothetical protein